MKAQNINNLNPNLDEGKRMVNPASSELSGDIGKRKAQDYPGADEAMTGEKPADRSRQEAPKANLGSQEVDEDDEDEGEGARGWDSAGHSGEAKQQIGNH